MVIVIEAYSKPSTPSDLLQATKNYGFAHPLFWVLLVKLVDNGIQISISRAFVVVAGSHVARRNILTTFTAKAAVLREIPQCEKAFKCSTVLLK